MIVPHSGSVRYTRICLLSSPEYDCTFVYLRKTKHILYGAYGVANMVERCKNGASLLCSYLGKERKGNLYNVCIFP